MDCYCESVAYSMGRDVTDYNVPSATRLEGDRPHSTPALEPWSVGGCTNSGQPDGPGVKCWIYVEHEELRFRPDQVKYDCHYIMLKYKRSIM